MPGQCKKCHASQRRASLGEGAIFRNWEDGYFDETLPFGYGLDFGSHDPDAFIQVAIDKNKKIIYAKELIYQNGLSTSQLIDPIRTHYTPNKLIVADSAGSRTIQDLKRRGLNVVPVKKTPVVDGIKLMLDFKIVVSPESTNLKSELRDYVWMDRKGEIPNDSNNHLIDALRYYFTQVVQPLPVFKGHRVMKK